MTMDGVSTLGEQAMESMQNKLVKLGILMEFTKRVIKGLNVALIDGSRVGQLRLFQERIG